MFNCCGKSTYILNVKGKQSLAKCAINFTKLSEGKQNFYKVTCLPSTGNFKLHCSVLTKHQMYVQKKPNLSSSFSCKKSKLLMSVRVGRIIFLFGKKKPKSFIKVNEST